MKSKHNFDMVEGSQEVFRLLLDALANPGRAVNISSQVKEFSANGKWLAPALTLLDNECGFFWDGQNEVGEEIRFLSGAAQVSLDEADFVFSANGEAEKVLAAIKSGTHRDPHTSALVFIDTESGGGSGKEEKQLMLKGPGVPPEGRNITLSQAEAKWVTARDAQKFEYPCGVELIFMRKDNSLLAITRKAAVTWLT